MSTIVEDYRIRRADKHEIPLINDLLDKYFHPEETLLKCLLSRLRQDDDDGRGGGDQLAEIAAEQRRVIEGLIVNFPCLVAVHTASNEIVGANVVIVSENPLLIVDDERNNRRSIADDAFATNCGFLATYYRLMNDMIAEAELFAKYPTARRALEFYAIAVSERHRRKGLSTLLLDEGMQLAAGHGVDLAFGLFTSPHSRRSAEKVGMTKIADVDLLDYRDAAGSQLFLHSAPHSVASVMAALVREKNSRFDDLRAKEC